jgi:GNAT superfamily N-acetyltransferase
MIFTYRIATSEDADTMHQLQLKTHTDILHEPLDMFKQIVDIGLSYLIELVDTNEVVGYALVHYLSDPKNVPVLGDFDSTKSSSIFIHDCVVHPRYQKTGLAYMFLSYVKEHLEYTTITIVALSTATKLWKNNGFVPVFCDNLSAVESYGKDASVMMCWKQKSA